MTGYTKADYFSCYSQSPVDPVTRKVYPIRLHYHLACRHRLGFSQRAARLISKYGLSLSDRVLVIGCGFNWLGEALTEQCGCETMGADPSPWIQEMKDKDGAQDLLDAIAGSPACDFDINSEEGKEIYDALFEERNYAITEILDEDLMTSESVDRIKSRFQPTLIVTEEMLQVPNLDDRAIFLSNAESFNCPIAHFIDGSLI